MVDDTADLGEDPDEARARALLHEHADRHLDGLLRDHGEVGAVAGVERLARALGTDDPARLVAALDARDPAAEEVVRGLADLLPHAAPGRARPDSGALNRDAGHHDVVTDAGLLRTAVRAASATFEAVPYYRARYGDRGARFAGSDTAWLVSLARSSMEEACEQVFWLAGLLAGRGMPSWLMERHLGDLVRALVAEHAPAAAGVLPGVEDAVAARRRRVVDDGLLSAGDAWLDEALGVVGVPAPVAGAGALLASAVADLGSGLARRDAPLVDWLVAPQRCEPVVAAVVLDVRQRLGAEAGVELPSREPRR